MIFKSAIRKNVPDVQTHLAQMATDEDSSVAIQGLLLNAHDGDSQSLGALGQPVQSLAEHRQLRDPIVDCLVADVAVLFFTSSPEFTAEEDVVDAFGLEDSLKAVPVEMLDAAVWPRPNVGNGRHSVTLE